MAVVVGCSGDDSVAATETSTTTATASTSSGTTSTTSDETNISDDSTTTSTSTSTSTGTNSTASPETTSTTSDTTTSGTTTSDTTGSLPDDIPEPFNEYCVATFTEAFEPPYMGFTIAPGDSFLYVFTFNEFHEMKYFGDDGPVSFDFEASEDNLPFTDNCESLYFWSVDKYLAALADVTLYIDKEMTEIACELTAGTVTPYEAGGGHGPAEYVEGGIIFEYEFFALSEICNGYDIGYAFVPEIVFFDTMTFPHPLDYIYGPA